jgi:cell division septation protein DedD
MKALHRLFLAACLAMAAAHPAFAAPAAVVEGVQMPAWVEHGDGRKTPLAPGMELKAGDQVRTGTNSRLLLKLSEGSLVKLGENAQLKIDELKADDGGVFKAALRIAEGAFRFTTDALTKNRRRAVNITAATVTTGIRGTDVWGKATANDRQVVCLIEGQVEVAAEGQKPFVLDQPRQFYQRNQGETAPIGFIDAAMLAQWAQETEIAPGQGAARAGGKWKVTLVAADTQEAALAVYAQVRANGYPAEIHPAKAGEKRVYLVRIGSLPSKAEAEALAAQLKGKMGVAAPRVSS